jgi:hypothetical protein
MQRRPEARCGSGADCCNASPVLPKREDLTLAPNTTANFTSPTLAFAGSAVATGLWFAALVAIPELQRSDLSIIVARIAVHLIVLGGTWAGLSRTSLTASERT